MNDRKIELLAAVERYMQTSTQRGRYSSMVLENFESEFIVCGFLFLPLCDDTRWPALIVQCSLSSVHIHFFRGNCHAFFFLLWETSKKATHDAVINTQPS